MSRWSPELFSVGQPNAPRGTLLLLSPRRLQTLVVPRAALVLTALVEGVVGPSSKLLLNLDRPTWPTPLATEPTTSYPSGHAAAPGSDVRGGMLLGAAITCVLAGCTSMARRQSTRDGLGLPARHWRAHGYWAAHLHLECPCPRVRLPVNERRLCAYRAGDRKASETSAQLSGGLASHGMQHGRDCGPSSQSPSPARPRAYE